MGSYKTLLYLHIILSSNRADYYIIDLPTNTDRSRIQPKDGSYRYS